MTNLGKLLVAVLAIATVVAVCANRGSPQKHTTDQSKVNATVTITRMDERSGGTGVIIKSTDSESLVLTNRHVCGVVVNGGLVKGDTGAAYVTSYQTSLIHDLCLIKVSTDLHVNTAIAKEAPSLYSTAEVSGHPRLNPAIVTKGTFGKKHIVSVMTGMKPCTKEDIEKDPANAFICAFLGGFPIIDTFEAQFTGATIQAGNSGSAVYNDKGEVAGLVFAGAGDLSYAEIVPGEYIDNFLNFEIPAGNLEVKKPNTQLLIDASSMMRTKLKNACFRVQMGDTLLAPISKYCNYNSDMIWDKE